MVRQARWMLLGLATIWVAGGCAPRSTVPFYYPHARSRTFTEDPADHYQRIGNIAEHDRKGLAEDLDLLFMTDRPSRLTRWHDR